MSNLSTFTVRRNTNFTVVNNEILRDDRISLKAKGLLITILALPPGWDLSIAGLQTRVKEGEEAIANAIIELEQFGYCRRERVRDEHGHFGLMSYAFYESPDLATDPIFTDDQPKPGNPVRGNPDGGNPAQLSKQGIKSSSDREKSSRSAATKSPQTAEEVVAELAANPAYAHVNVVHEAQKAQVWISNNPGRRFTKRFFIKWLTRLDRPLQLDSGPVPNIPIPQLEPLFPELKVTAVSDGRHGL